MMLFFFNLHISIVVIAGNSGATAEQQRSQSGAAGNSGDTMTIQTFAKTSIGEVKRLIVCCVTFARLRWYGPNTKFLFLLA